MANEKEEKTKIFFCPTCGTQVVVDTEEIFRERMNVNNNKNYEALLDDLNEITKRIKELIKNK